MARDKAKYEIGNVVKLANKEGLDFHEEAYGKCGIVTKVYDDNYSYDVLVTPDLTTNVTEYHIDELVTHPPLRFAVQSRLFPYWH